MTPKEFMLQFINSNNPDLAYLRRHWGQEKGIDSSIQLAGALRDEITKSPVGRHKWNDFIQEEVSNLVSGVK